MLNGNRDRRRASVYWFALKLIGTYLNVKCIDSQILEMLLKVNWHRASVMRVYGQVSKYKKQKTKN